MRFLIIVIVLVVIIGLYYWYNNQSTAANTPGTPAAVQTTTAVKPGTNVKGPDIGGGGPTNPITIPRLQLPASFSVKFPTIK